MLGINQVVDFSSTSIYCTGEFIFSSKRKLPFRNYGPFCLTGKPINLRKNLEISTSVCATAEDNHVFLLSVEHTFTHLLWKGVTARCSEVKMRLVVMKVSQKQTCKSGFIHFFQSLPSAFLFGADLNKSYQSIFTHYFILSSNPPLSLA